MKKKIMILMIMMLSAFPSITAKADFVVMHEDFKPFIAGLEKAEEPIGVLYANKETTLYTGPNTFTDELGAIGENEEIEYYQVMANNWIRINKDGVHGYTDKSLLRDTLTPPEKKMSEGRKSDMTFRLSFYTSLPEENGGYTTTASGKKPQFGMVASNVYPIGTKIYLEGYGEMTVEDRGGKHFNSADRLDVFIPRREGEGKGEYKKRVLGLGRKEVGGYIRR